MQIFWAWVWPPLTPIWWNVKKNPARLARTGFLKQRDVTQKFTYCRTHVSLFYCLVQILLCSVVETWPMWPWRLEDSKLEHFSTLRRVNILKMLESLTAVEGYRMLWQLLAAVVSCESFYELWQLLSDVSSGGFNKLWNLCQTSSWFGLPTGRQGKTMIGPGTNKKFKFSYQPRQVSDDCSGGWLNGVLDFSDTNMQVRKNNFVMGMQVAHVRGVLEEEIKLRRQTNKYLM